MLNLVRTNQRSAPVQAHFLEYYLAISMLIALVILVIIVLYVPLSGNDTLEFRRTSLTLIVTAFSAWIGAGAAYFFGKENLRVATESLTSVITPPKERLAQTPVTLGAKKLD